MNIKQYIEINKLDKEDKYYYSNILNVLNVDNSTMTIKEVIEKVKELTEIKPSTIKNKIKINKKWFMIEQDITKSSFNQFISLESYLNDNDFFINNLNEVLSIYVRPRIFNWKKLRYEIEKFDSNNKKKNDDLLLEMNINDAFGLNVFFYQNAQVSIKNMKIHYLNDLMMKIDQMMKLII